MKKIQENRPKVAVIGGGIAGSTIALYLGEIGVDVTLFEKGPSLVNGPPICHLHAGGNLYREISDEQCVTLLKESIDLVRFYPHAVDYRPTVVSIPIEDKAKPNDLFERLNMLQKTYAQLIQDDVENKVLGEAKEYYKLYDYETVLELQQMPTVSSPKTLDEWMIPVAKHIDLQKVQFPLIMVQEYGLNVFRLASTVSLLAKENARFDLRLEHKVRSIKESNDGKWSITYKHDEKVDEESFDFLINAAGFRTGKVDNMLGYKRERFVEFKAAYVTQCDTQEIWPEVVFLGERGTPRGMAQFTPYPDGYFQLHGMTKSITLFEEGLVKSTALSAYPKLNTKFMHKIEKAWKPADVQKRSKLAIKHLAQYIPAFIKAEVVSKPLYGAQQIPGDDDTLRAANVSFEGEYYARCEIVKASSVLSMSDIITKQFIKLGYVQEQMHGRRNFPSMKALVEEKVSEYAQALCEEREYPISLAKRVINEMPD